MTYLAFDPLLLVEARRRAAALAEGLARLRSSDPLASAANNALQTLVAQLRDQWLPLIDRVLDCPALTEAERRVITPTDLQRAVLDEVLARQWRLVDDPRETAGLSVEQVRLLAKLLAEDAEHRFTGDELDRHLTDEDAEIRWLAEALDAIAADEHLRKVFIDSFDAWPQLMTWVSARSVQLIGAAAEEPKNPAWTARRTEFDHLLGALARLAAGPGTGSEPPAMLAELTPYAAALLVARMDLEPRTRATVTAELINRYWEGDPQRNFLHLDRIGDVLLPAILAEPDSAPIVLEMVDPQALYFASLDTTLTERLLLAGTDPAERVHRASSLLSKFLDHRSTFGEYAVPPGSDFQVEAALAAMAAPWLGWMISRYEFLGWTKAERNRRLDVIVSTEQARQVLLDSRGMWVANLARQHLVDGAGRPNVVVLHDIAATLTTVLNEMRAAEVSEAKQSVFIGDMVAKLAALAPELVSMKRPGAEKIAKESVGRAVDAAVAYLRRNEILPPTAEQVDERAAAEWRQRSLDGKVHVVVLTLALMEHQGGLPAGFVERIDEPDVSDETCPAEDLEARLAELSSTPGLTVDQRNDVAAVVSTMLNTGEASQLCP